jgi:hypothetical protein
MATNDGIILDQVLERQRQTLAPGLDAAAYFEVLTAEQLLKDYDLSYDEIESGIVAGGGDGGIDAPDSPVWSAAQLWEKALSVWEFWLT